MNSNSCGVRINASMRATTVLWLCLSACIVAQARRSTSSNSESLPVYFGQGCMWHVQHELVQVEQQLRSGPVTARTGYAGGSGANIGSSVCYHNKKGSDYGDNGYAEVVGLNTTKANFASFAQRFFELFVNGDRQDTQDIGPMYRSLVGLPGGIKSDLFGTLQSKNTEDLELVAGSGGDADTSGLRKVWVMDSDKFPFKVAEKYHQFHDDMSKAYSKDYHKLKDGATPTECPDQPLCEGAMPMCEIAPKFPSVSSLERNLDHFLQGPGN